MWRQTSVKTGDFFLRNFTRATTPATYLSIIFPPFPHTLSFAILYPSTSIMCFKPIPVGSRPCSNITHRRQRNPANLRPFPTSSTTPLFFFLHGSLKFSVSCQQSRLHFRFFLYNPHSASWAWLRPGFLSLTPHVKLAGVGALVCSFQIIGNTQPTLPYAITTHLNLMRLL